ncbi:MAG: ABC transporter ATP-binding protein [Maritimibacter sp.]|nr:ABC transporter ATP-binding protein [Maritimibacter sp.]
MAELEISGLRLGFGGLTVLDDVSLSVAPGELFALIGPNGAGKTSVFNCISGIYRPTAGTIRFGGQDLIGLSPHEIARRGVVRTFQHGELFREMSVIDNLLAGRHAKFRTGPVAEALFLPSARREEVAHREAVEKIVEFVELEAFRHAPVGGLPFGIQKLAGFARALASDPKILLLDEPSAGLNRDEREDLARFLMRIKDELGLPMIWIEHDMQMVADLADRVQVLDYGKTISVGTPGEVLSDQHVINAYLGVPD